MDGVSFEIHQSEILGIIGPNGAGKTSLLKCIQGMNSEFQGMLQLEGKNIQDLSTNDIAQIIAVVPQQSSSLFDLTVYDVVRMGLLPHKRIFHRDSQEDVALMSDSLEKVGMEGFQKRSIEKLSGGELQRVLIARALVQKAKILLLDEPTNHLDVYYQHEILGLLHSLDQTVVMTIHDLNLAAQYCDRLMLMRAGRVLAQGTVVEVLQEQLLEEAFDLPCSVQLTPQKVPSVCFHPQPDKAHSS